MSTTNLFLNTIIYCLDLKNFISSCIKLTKSQYLQGTYLSTIKRYFIFWPIPTEKPKEPEQMLQAQGHAVILSLYWPEAVICARKSRYTEVASNCRCPHWSSPTTVAQVLVLYLAWRLSLVLWLYLKDSTLSTWRENSVRRTVRKSPIRYVSVVLWHIPFHSTFPKPNPEWIFKIHTYLFSATLRKCVTFNKKTTNGQNSYFLFIASLLCVSNGCFVILQRNWKFKCINTLVR